MARLFALAFGDWVISSQVADPPLYKTAPHCRLFGDLRGFSAFWHFRHADALFRILPAIELVHLNRDELCTLGDRVIDKMAPTFAKSVNVLW